jgi:single-stranded DNA-binding protein
MQASTATIVGIVRRKNPIRAAGSSQVINLTVPVNNFGKDAGTTWWDIEVWGKAAENIDQYVSEGMTIAAVGRPEMSTYKANDGTEKSKMVLRSASISWDKKNDGGYGDEF